ncbi:hypothetical protein DXG03_003173 [Asterophora parasitica]|uniref:Homeobox domain-containing protein n=1 Tax=Asterophora parasitica TaxID=117018 RepID=A0A9P7GK91_9AGAR|nr:hypothetical protein DXG03_003173 [Asterophora parasitica]
MLSRPVPRYPFYGPPHPTPTAHLPPYPPGLSMDPSSVDFRAFYPYTPNEVKHRKRTTSSQLRVLEAVFKHDTKPNAALRAKLALQLDMKPRGVQVWFQNRRAKEKGKASKAAKAAKAEQKESEDPAESPDDVEGTSESPAAHVECSPSVADLPEQRASSSSQTSSPNAPSPPSLHVITDPSPSPSWVDSPVDHHSLYVDPALHAYRRGSLPVNVFPGSDFSSNSPPHYDTFDPLARRLSVDASLQRLASNPFAELARAKNGVIFGQRAIAPNRHRPLGRAPYVPPPRVASSASMPYGVRRASMGNFRISPQSTASPSPSPLSPYHGVRASLPDHSLYAVPPRTMASPIPGPLPSPNYSFGAANTPSIVSGSSGDSERNSPDFGSPYGYRESEQDEDENTAASYYALSRFGSITSIATSDSSINSSYYPEVVSCYPEPEIDMSRRDSCASGHFASLMSNLDVNGVHEPVGSPQDHGVYTLHEDVNVNVVGVVASNSSHVETSTYPSPTSTISPGTAGSPHVQGTPLSSVPISRSSELNHALQSQSDQPKIHDQTINTADQQSFVNGHIIATPAPAPAPAIEAEIHPASEQYFYPQDASHPQATSLQTAAVEFTEHKYNYEYDAPCAYLTESYAPVLLEGGGDMGLHHHSFEPPHMSLGYNAMGAPDPTAHHPDQYTAYT